jgi:hypothetical protein
MRVVEMPMPVTAAASVARLVPRRNSFVDHL